MESAKIFVKDTTAILRSSGLVSFCVSGRMTDVYRALNTLMQVSKLMMTKWHDLLILYLVGNADEEVSPQAFVVSC